jgi:hypothetical protein
MPSAGLEPVIPAMKLLQTYDLDRTATSIVSLNNIVIKARKIRKKEQV